MDNIYDVDTSLRKKLQKILHCNKTIKCVDFKDKIMKYYNVKYDKSLTFDFVSYDKKLKTSRNFII